MKSIVVSHPHGNRNSKGTAIALHQAGILQSFQTGAAFSRDLNELIPNRFRNRVLDLPQAKIRSHPFLEATCRALGKAPGALSAYDAMFVAHDMVVAASGLRGADALYTYEDCALLSFERAKRKDIRCIWELPLPHYATLESMWAEEQARHPTAQGSIPRREPEWKKSRKDRELALADDVVVASAFTKESLEAIDIQKRIEVIPYGFPVESFRPKSNQPAGPFTILSVGTHDLRKGTPYLLEAFQKANLRDARLVLAGRVALKDSYMAQFSKNVEVLGPVPAVELEALYQSADLLAFPTLGDGFGLVIQEAMCCGTPVVTTRCGGGPESIDPLENGWLIPERNVDALVEQFRACALDRDATHQMGMRARAKAETYSWHHASEHIVRWVSGL